MRTFIACAAATLAAAPIAAQSTSQETALNGAAAQPAAAMAAAPAARVGTGARTVNANLMLVVTPQAEISSKTVEVGQKVMFIVVNDVVDNGQIVIPRGTPVTGTISWKTGRAIGGKSGKFDVTFTSLELNGRSVPMRGQHRQEGRGNTAAALLGSMFISGRSAVMLPGQLVNAFTAEPITY